MVLGGHFVYLEKAAAVACLTPFWNDAKRGHNSGRVDFGVNGSTREGCTFKEVK